MYFDRIIAVRNNKTIYRDGERCLKVFEDEYSVSHVLSEALNQVRAAEAGLDVPNVLEVTTIDGRWVIASKFIRGKTLAQLMSERPEMNEVYLKALVRLQIRVHEKQCLECENMKDRFNKLINRADLQAAERVAFHRQIDELTMGNQLCHGDLNPSNIIITEAGLPFILDWSCAMSGNPFADAAASFLSIYLTNGENMADSYLRFFCEAQGIGHDTVLCRIPLVAATKLTYANMHERQLLRRWIKTDNAIKEN